MRAGWLVLLLGCAHAPDDPGSDSDPGSDPATDEPESDSEPAADTDPARESDPPDTEAADSDTDVLPPVPEHPTWSLDVAGMITGRCRPCHTSDPPNGDFSVLALDHIVDWPSNQLPSMDLVEPGDLERSYLWHKLDGTQATVGGSGRRMPRSGGRLDAREMLLVQRWIEQGALP